MDSSSDTSFALSWCTLAPEPIIKSPLKTFTILIGSPNAPAKLEYPQGLIMSWSRFFRNLFKSSKERKQDTVFGMQARNREAVDAPFSEPDAVDDPSSEPEACFREALDKTVDLTWVDPTALFEHCADYLPLCWPQDANGLDAIFKAYLLADYFMDAHTRKKAVLEMERLTGIAPQIHSKRSKLPKRLTSTQRFRLSDSAAVVPSWEFIWFVYDATVSLSGTGDESSTNDENDSTSDENHSTSGNVGDCEIVRDEARQFLMNYFAATGTKLPDLGRDLPEEFEHDLWGSLQRAKRVDERSICDWYYWAEHNGKLIDVWRAFSWACVRGGGWDSSRSY